MKRCDFKLNGFSCAEEAICAYIDGELSESEIKKLEEHIKNCSECSECGAGVAAVLCLSLIASPLFKKAFSLDENSAEYAVGDADMLNYGAYMKSPSDSDVDCASPAEEGANGAECAEAKGANGNFDVIWFDDSGDAEDRAADGGENDVFNSPALFPEFSSDCLKFSMTNSNLRPSCYNDLCLNVLEYPETTADKIPEYEHPRGSLD